MLSFTPYNCQLKVFNLQALSITRCLFFVLLCIQMGLSPVMAKGIRLQLYLDNWPHHAGYVLHSSLTLLCSVSQ